MLLDFSDIVSHFDQGIRLSVRAKPGSARARAPKIVDVGDGKRAIEIAVAAPAQEGKANKAICEALADYLAVGKKNVALKAGDTGKIKIIEITGIPAQLEMKTLLWLSKL